MKAIKFIPLYFIGGLIASSLIVSCNSEEIVEELTREDVVQEHVIKMKMNATIDQYSSSTRADSTWKWKDGDRIFLKMKNSSGAVLPAEAKYSSTTNDWTISYTGMLQEGDSISCESYFIDKVYAEYITGVTYPYVRFNYESAVYEDSKSYYSFKTGSDLILTANLSPKTGRIRFKGNASNGDYAISGFKYYSILYHTFNRSDNFGNDDINIVADSFSNGYTPYYYGYFSGSSTTITCLNNGYEYTTTLPSWYLTPGNSGWMNMPTADSHNQWTQTLRSQRSISDMSLYDRYTTGLVSLNNSTSSIFAMKGDTLSMSYTLSCTISVDTCQFIFYSKYYDDKTGVYNIKDTIINEPKVGTKTANVNFVINKTGYYYFNCDAALYAYKTGSTMNYSTLKFNNMAIKPKKPQ